MDCTIMRKYSDRSVIEKESGLCGGPNKVKFSDAEKRPSHLTSDRLEQVTAKTGLIEIT